MSTKKQSTTQGGELIPVEKTITWTVITAEDGVHRLRYGTKTMEKGKTPADLARLQEIARFANRRDLKPAPRIQCIADLASHPVKALKKSERADPYRPIEETPAES
jgi:hypothetical protein